VDAGVVGVLEDEGHLVGARRQLLRCARQFTGMLTISPAATGSRGGLAA
jgi:hypothetical protein